jgi:hypothetical protein
MDPLSLAASIAALAGLVASVVSTTYAYGSSVIGASKAQKSFLKELQSLRQTLQQLDGVVADTEVSSPQYPHVSAKLTSTVNYCQKDVEELQEKLQKKLDAGKIKRNINCLTWPLAESETLKTVETLGRYRGLFQLALNIDTW